VASALVVGTRKGLFLIRNGRAGEPLLPGWEVFHAIVDPRDGVLHAAANNFVRRDGAAL
jgi:hypothetical protein